MNAPVAHLGIRARHPGRDRVAFGLRLLKGHAGLQPAGDEDDVIETNLLRAIDRERHVDVAAGKEIEGSRRDADHRDRRAVQRDDAADERWVSAETTCPQTLADHGHRRARLLFRVGESASRDRRDPEHVQQRGADAVADELLGLSRAAQIEAGESDRRELVERPHLLAPRHEIQHRCAEVRKVEPIVLLGDLDEAMGIGERQRPEQHRVHDGEHRRVRGDRQRDGQHDGRRERRRPPDRAERVPKIVHQHVRLLPWNGDDEIARDVEPDAERRFVPGAVAEHLRHLAAVLAAEFSRIQPEQGAIQAIGSEHYLVGSNPAARAWRTSVARWPISSFAIRRPRGVIR